MWRAAGEGRESRDCSRAGGNVRRGEHVDRGERDSVALPVPFLRPFDALRQRRTYSTAHLQLRSGRASTGRRNSPDLRRGATRLWRGFRWVGGAFVGASAEGKQAIHCSLDMSWLRRTCQSTGRRRVEWSWSRRSGGRRGIGGRESARGKRRWQFLHRRGGVEMDWATGWCSR